MPDLRELAKEYEELKERQTEADCDCGPQSNEVDAEPCDIHDPAQALDETEIERLAALAALDDQLFCSMEEYGRNAPDLILESEFEDYAREFAHDVGWATSDAEENNPLIMHIDWARWAEAMKQDYSEVEFDGDTYLIRAY